jgi:hypothetical protein
MMAIILCQGRTAALGGRLSVIDRLRGTSPSDYDALLHLKEPRYGEANAAIAAVIKAVLPFNLISSAPRRTLV